MKGNVYPLRFLNLSQSIDPIVETVKSNIVNGTVWLSMRIV